MPTPVLDVYDSPVYKTSLERMQGFLCTLYDNWWVSTAFFVLFECVSLVLCIYHNVLEYIWKWPRSHLGPHRCAPTSLSYAILTAVYLDAWSILVSKGIMYLFGLKQVPFTFNKQHYAIEIFLEHDQIWDKWLERKPNAFTISFQIWNIHFPCM